MPYEPKKRSKYHVIFDTVPVRCPRCGWRLLDAVPPAVAEVQQLQLALDTADSWRPDYYIKCQRCGAYIAFRKSIDQE